MRHFATNTRRRARSRHGVLVALGAKMLSNVVICGVLDRVLDRAVFLHTVKGGRNIRNGNSLAILEWDSGRPFSHMISVKHSKPGQGTSQLYNRLSLNSLSASGEHGGFSWAG